MTLYCCARVRPLTIFIIALPCMPVYCRLYALPYLHVCFGILSPQRFCGENSYPKFARGAYMVYGIAYAHSFSSCTCSHTMPSVPYYHCGCVYTFLVLASSFSIVFLLLTLFYCFSCVLYINSPIFILHALAFLLPYTPFCYYMHCPHCMHCGLYCVLALLPTNYLTLYPVLPCVSFSVVSSLLLLRLSSILLCAMPLRLCPCICVPFFLQT